MNYKSDVLTTVTRNTLSFEKGTNNIYESLVVISKRANQISAEMKEELNGKLSEFNQQSDNLEEIFENREQIEISKYYERLPKPTLIALQEYAEDKIYYRNPANETL
ncbi:MAG: DNA-directed RNA polymerase subunit omega [Bacteroidetes bacterium]|nr:DNA-directed RNA polymerase subunit omega [Bacteroidota bacterium]